MRNYVQKGDTVTVLAPADTASGAAVLVGAIFGFAVASAKSGEPLELKTVGVFDDAKKAAGAAWSVGDALYWDATEKELTKTATNNKLVGAAFAAAGTAATVGAVRIGYPVVV
ncbi:MAG TPA: DUF2190 family protein [Xanthobacteraceae bacterium]|nr:DUF2190 family protein [Xanthobacteraceae bacterium]